MAKKMKKAPKAKTSKARKRPSPKARTLAKAADSPLARLRKAKSIDDARSAVIDIIGDTECHLTETGRMLADAADIRPDAVRSFGNDLAKSGMSLCFLAGPGGESVSGDMKLLLLHRQQIIDELEINSAAEFLLLDGAMDAYLHWVSLTKLARACYRDGTNSEVSRYQARISAMAQSYLKMYMESMKALADMKRPPIRVLKVQAGENVAVQVNEQARPGESQHANQATTKRRKALETAPADPEAD